MTISTTALAITVVFKGGGGTKVSPSKDKRTLKKWLHRLADALKRLAGKAAEALPAIIGSVAGAILSFLGKAVGFVAEHTWALTVFVAGLISICKEVLYLRWDEHPFRAYFETLMTLLQT